MKKTLFFTLAFCFLKFVAIAQSEQGYSLTVVVQNFESNKGTVHIGLYTNSKNWLEEAARGEISPIDNKKAIYTFKNVPDGVYGVSVFHDENDNGKLDVGYFGIPKEPYACSRDAKATFSAPKWEDAKFLMSGNDQEITINL